MIKKLLPLFFLVFITGVFFWQFLLRGLLPIPSDTIVGLYYPYRDLYSKEYPNGIPFKNFLITDPVRQQYPWRKLTDESLKSYGLPAWNPYSFSGTPNIANFQSAVFYPFNIVFFVLPFEYSWTLLIILEPLLASIFMFVFLRALKLDKTSNIFGSIVFAFGGFFTTWLEWGTVLHVALWLPLILLAIDKLVNKDIQGKFSIFNFQFSKTFVWFVILLFSTVSSFFAGHLQTFFYLSIVSLAYFLFRLLQAKANLSAIFAFLIFSILFLILTVVQWAPTLQFLNLSARSVDQNFLNTPGWFIPWQHLIQFLAPDFFGNPTTLNYFGTWNYGELAGYVGITALILALFALFNKKTKEIWFFLGILALSLLLAFSNFISKIPFVLNIPFFSTAQPTRLLFIIDFSLSILSAFGFNYLLTNKKIKNVAIPITLVGALFGLLFVLTQFGGKYIDISNLAIAKRNLIFPILIFISSSIVILGITKINRKFTKYLIILLILITLVDLFRFSWKFNTFSKKEYLYPTSGVLNFLQKNTGNYRIATSDSRILPPNFSVVHKLQSVEGYDPLFTARYAEFISAINRDKPDISSPFGFNRIVRLQNFSSKFADLLGVKYVLSMSQITDPKFVKVYEDGQTKIYENTLVLPRAFSVQNVIGQRNREDVIESMFTDNFDPINEAVVEDLSNKSFSPESSVSIVGYWENKVVVDINSKSETFLVLTDSYYPTWHAKLGNGKKLQIYRTDYNFRGVIVPKGRNTVIFYNSLL